MTLYVSDEVREKAKQALLSYGIFRWESAVVIAGSLVLATITRLTGLGIEALQSWWWMWLLFGAAGEGALIYSTMNDRAALSKVLDDLFRQQFDLTKLRSKELRQKVAKALEYRALIVREIERKDNFVLDDTLMSMAAELEDWIKHVYDLAMTLDNFGRDNVFSRDIQQVPRELEQMRQRLSKERSGTVRQELEQSIQTKEKQWDAMRNLNDSMRRAQLKLENTLSAMGTLYMQVMQIGAQEMDNSRAQRLQADMHEQILSLEDVSEAMQEVYQMSGQY